MVSHYYQPTTLTECLQLLADNRLKVIAGCTDVFPFLAAQRAWGEAVMFGVGHGGLGAMVLVGLVVGATLIVAGLKTICQLGDSI